jgi:hypothetical protein
VLAVAALSIAAVFAAPVHASGIRAGFDTLTRGEIGDRPGANAALGFDMDLGSSTYSTVWVHNNGHPVFADVDARNADTYSYLTMSYGTGAVDGRNSFGIRWDSIGYSNRGDDKLDAFQLIIIDRSDRAAGDWDLEFDYEQIEWEVGDVHGSGGLVPRASDPAARAGSSGGTDSFDPFDGPGRPGR